MPTKKVRIGGDHYEVEMENLDHDNHEGPHSVQGWIFQPADPAEVSNLGIARFLLLTCPQQVTTPDGAKRSIVSLLESDPCWRCVVDEPFEMLEIPEGFKPPADEKGQQDDEEEETSEPRRSGATPAWLIAATIPIGMIDRVQLPDADRAEQERPKSAKRKKRRKSSKKTKSPAKPPIVHRDWETPWGLAVREAQAVLVNELRK